MKPCEVCDGAGWTRSPTAGPRDIDYSVCCPECGGEGWVRDPLVPRDRGAESYRPLQ